MPKKSSEVKRTQIGVKLNSDLWKEFKILALQLDRTAGDLLEDAMKEYLKNRQTKISTEKQKK